VLDETIAANPGMSGVELNIEDAASIRVFADRMAKDFPSLNVVVNNAGIMRPENLQAEPIDLTDAEATVTTNLLGPIRLTARYFRCSNGNITRR
jgi:Short-chain dehydrogenase involved in D-alanine esterification of lipoteichoic acid and wall teichoic acid (D-alanine transfer protein)